MKKKSNREDITGVPKKGIDSLYQYYTVFKSPKKGQQSFRLTSQLVKNIYKKASSLKKEGLIILILPFDSNNNFRLECIIKSEIK